MPEAAVGRLHAERVGRGPARARAHVAEDVVLVVRPSDAA
ncbi:hypothetical protein DSM104299_03102 [Baekduia alba]|nr:hypothetical protein DSM104299_03102 [Baekduia alba]